MTITKEEQEQIIYDCIISEGLPFLIEWYYIEKLKLIFNEINNKSK